MAVAATQTQAQGAAAFVFGQRRQFLVKTVLLGAATFSLIPILLYKSEVAANVYLVLLAAVHVAGIVIIAVGTKRHQIAPDTRGLLIRLAGLAILVGLLVLAAKGLRTNVTQWVFWGSLFAIWALHTAGLALLHIKGRRENQVCPFV